MSREPVSPVSRCPESLFSAARPTPSTSWVLRQRFPASLLATTDNDLRHVYGVIVARDNTTASVDGGMGNETRAFAASRDPRTNTDLEIDKPAPIMPAKNAPTLPAGAPLTGRA